MVLSALLLATIFASSSAEPDPPCSGEPCASRNEPEDNVRALPSNMPSSIKANPDCLFYAMDELPHLERDSGLGTLEAVAPEICIRVVHRAPVDFLSAEGDWQNAGRADAEAVHCFLIAMQQQNLDVLDQKFKAISNPDSQHWLQFMTIAEIDELLEPKAKDKIAVKEWLAQYVEKGGVQFSGDSLSVCTSVRNTEELFKTHIHRFIHNRSGHVVLRSLGTYSVPLSVHAAIDFVTGVAGLPHAGSSRPKMSGYRSTEGNFPWPCGRRRRYTALVTPQTIYKMYSVPENASVTYETGNVSQAAIMIGGTQTIFLNTSAQTFYEEMGYPQIGFKMPPKPKTWAEGDDAEELLDVEYLGSVGRGAVNWFWIGDNWIYDWANEVFKAQEVPDVFSISLGMPETEQCGGKDAAAKPAECNGATSRQYVARVNTEFQKLGLRGVSLMVASGDAGAQGVIAEGPFHPEFPTASPYVTSVGATALRNPLFDSEGNLPRPCSSTNSSCLNCCEGRCASGGEEIVSEMWKSDTPDASITSGGGFSAYSLRPEWQEQDVTAYLDNAPSLPNSTKFNRTNRAYPDVAALGAQFLTYGEVIPGDGPQWFQQSGTSASTPTFAGLTAYLNGLSRQKLGKPLGFLNPLLYKMSREAPHTFTDIVSGSNGFKATAGWDPATGLGTPVLSNMLAYVETLLTRQHLRPHVFV